MLMPQVPFDDRGLAYGDGVFETVLLRAGAPVLWDYHHARLVKGCQRLNIPLPSMEQLIASWQSPPTAELEILKLVLTRGSGGRGYATPDNSHPRLMSRRTPFVVNADRWHEGVNVRLCQLRLGHQPLLAGIKHLNRLENVLARQEWNDPSIAEGLLGDTDGWLVEATSMNVFWQQAGTLFTPPLSQCGVAGTLRAALLDRGVVQEATIALNAIHEVDRLWVANSVQGVWPVSKLLSETGATLQTWPLLGQDRLQEISHHLLGYSPTSR
ncbi:aminodeoxychorismate lyase [Vreelandella andesensis]|uniref:Aminodeoxychorismate lyase n=1 Tax=Vreelandella andesensis TaxID=447567 RepID=A0A3S0YKG5_9GAMM|nr:aminodeoxychorismate lyase [Halomonas andesensis]RUR32431.1 aminodeoxychorismate lyase [Halomonas andesensis]